MVSHSVEPVGNCGKPERAPTSVTSLQCVCVCLLAWTVITAVRTILNWYTYIEMVAGFPAARGRPLICSFRVVYKAANYVVATCAIQVVSMRDGKSGLNVITYVANLPRCRRKSKL